MSDLVSLRQGDVYVEQLAEPIAFDKDKHELITDPSGRVVLAYGEVTGHAHVINNKDAVLFKDATNDKVYLVLLTPAKLQHEEHKEINLPSGTFEVVRQREWVLGSSRQVAD